MFSLLYKLYKVNLLSIKGIIVLFNVFRKHGVNLMAMLHFAAKMKPNRQGLSDEKNSYTYLEFYKNAHHLAVVLERDFGIDRNKRVAILCRNHSIGIQTLLAFSRLGCDVVILNVDMSSVQVKRIIKQKHFDVVVYDPEMVEKVSDIQSLCLASYGVRNTIESMLEARVDNHYKLLKQKAGSISVHTGGTSGRVKFAGRKYSKLGVLMPFLTLLNKLNLHRYTKVYIAVPMYHGYGLTALIISIILNSEIYVRRRFETSESAQLIAKENIEVVVLVPTMLKRMFETTPKQLQNIKKVLSGGAPLNQSLVVQVQKRLGSILFNLYGTSESGFSVMATPEDLERYPSTIGKKIKGVSLRIIDESGKDIVVGKVGAMIIRTGWAVHDSTEDFISTGDMGYVNKRGYLFLKGRRDNMIISGGENVYPKDVELALLDNSSIDEVVVVSVEDKYFGKRLIAFVAPVKGESLESDFIKAWLKMRIARYQMPYQIVVVNRIPYQSTGKYDVTKLIETARIYGGKIDS